MRTVRSSFFENMDDVRDDYSKDSQNGRLRGCRSRLLGDAARLMSPNGGQGINMALRDALVVANYLCPVLTCGAAAADIDVVARQVMEERMPEIVAIQEHQRKQTQTFLCRTVSCPGWRCDLSLS